jgi:hypothetical protein
MARYYRTDSTQATGLRWVSAVGGGNVTTDTLSLNKLEFGHPGKY